MNLLTIGLLFVDCECATKPPWFEPYELSLMAIYCVEGPLVSFGWIWRPLDLLCDPPPIVIWLLFGMPAI